MPHIDSHNTLYPLIKAVLILLLVFLIISGLYLAKMLFIPLAFSMILAMLLIPLCQYFEKKGLNRPIASLICVAILLAFIFAFGALLSTQIASFSEDFQELQEQVQNQFSRVTRFFQENFGISPQEAVQGNTSETLEFGPVMVGFFGSFTAVLANSLLALVYLFMLINYRSHFSKFILKAVPKNHKEKTKRILKDSGSIAQQYLAGRCILIIFLAIMYIIGLLLVGVEHAILFSILAALISIIPYIGNIIGISFPLLMAVVQGGGMWMFLGIVLVFSITQFIENYFLEPYIVGAEVNIHPFFTIVVIIAGELIWGIPGMILALPILAILKIVMENIDPLKPYAYLIGNSTEESSFLTFKERMKSWLKQEKN